MYVFYLQNLGPMERDISYPWTCDWDQLFLSEKKT